MQLVHEILRSHDRVEPRHFVFFFFFFSLCSMHERLAFVYRDFSTRLSNLSLLPPLPLLVADPCKWSGADGGAGERGPPRGGRKKKRMEKGGMYRSRTRSTATPRTVARMGERGGGQGGGMRRGTREEEEDGGYTKPLVLPPVAFFSIPYSEPRDSKLMISPDCGGERIAARRPRCWKPAATAFLSFLVLRCVGGMI